MNELVSVLNSNDESDRVYAAHDIARSNDPQMAEDLVKALEKEEQQVVKDAIVYALKSIPCIMIYERLFALFSSPDAFLRNQAVAIFGSEGNNAVPYLVSKLDHTNHEIRKLILDSLFEIGNSDAVLAIRAYIHDDAMNVKIAAVEYLGRLNDMDSVPELVEVFKTNTEAMLRSSILETLLAIGDAKAIKDVLDLIHPKDTLTMVEPPVYLPQLIDLVCKSGNKEDVMKVLKTLGNNSLFADNIVAGLFTALYRYPDLLLDNVITLNLLDLLMNKNVRDDVRMMIAEIVSNSTYATFFTEKDFLMYGQKLITEPALVIGGLKLLNACTSREALDCIRNELNKTENIELKMLYEDLLNGSLKDIYKQD